MAPMAVWPISPALVEIGFASWRYHDPLQITRKALVLAEDMSWADCLNTGALEPSGIPSVTQRC